MRTCAALLILLALTACDAGRVESNRKAPPPRPGVDIVYDAIKAELDKEHAASAATNAGFDTLEQVRKNVSRRLDKLELSHHCQSGKSYALAYSLSALPGKVSIIVNCGGSEKRGEWKPK